MRFPRLVYSIQMWPAHCLLVCIQTLLVQSEHLNHGANPLLLKTNSSATNTQDTRIVKRRDEIAIVTRPEQNIDAKDAVFNVIVFDKEEIYIIDVETEKVEKYRDNTRHHYVVAQMGESSYVKIGGTTEVNHWNAKKAHYSKRVVIYDTTTDSESEGPEMEPPRINHALVRLTQRSVMICGGVSDTEQRQRGTFFLSRCDILEKHGKGNFSFSSAPSMNTKREQLVLAKVGDTVFAIGGRKTFSDHLDTIEKLVDSKWIVDDMRLDKRRAFPACAVVGKHIYVCGGQSSSTEKHDSCEKFHFDDEKLTRVTTDLQLKWKSHYTKLVPVDNHFVVFDSHRNIYSLGAKHDIDYRVGTIEEGKPKDDDINVYAAIQIPTEGCYDKENECFETRRSCRLPSSYLGHQEVTKEGDACKDWSNVAFRDEIADDVKSEIKANVYTKGHNFCRNSLRNTVPHCLTFSSGIAACFKKCPIPTTPSTTTTTTTGLLTFKPSPSTEVAESTTTDAVIGPIMDLDSNEESTSTILSTTIESSSHLKLSTSSAPDELTSTSNPASVSRAVPSTTHTATVTKTATLPLSTQVSTSTIVLLTSSASATSIPTTVHPETSSLEDTTAQPSPVTSQTTLDGTTTSNAPNQTSPPGQEELSTSTDLSTASLTTTLAESTKASPNDTMKSTMTTQEVYSTKSSAPIQPNVTTPQHISDSSISSVSDTSSTITKLESLTDTTPFENKSQRTPTFSESSPTVSESSTITTITPTVSETTSFIVTSSTSFSTTSSLLTTSQTSTAEEDSSSTATSAVTSAVTTVTSLPQTTAESPSMTNTPIQTVTLSVTNPFPTPIHTSAGSPLQTSVSSNSPRGAPNSTEMLLSTTETQAQTVTASVTNPPPTYMDTSRLLASASPTSSSGAPNTIEMLLTEAQTVTSSVTDTVPATTQSDIAASAETSESSPDTTPTAPHESTSTTQTQTPLPDSSDSSTTPDYTSTKSASATSASTSTSAPIVTTIDTTTSEESVTPSPSAPTRLSTGMSSATTSSPEATSANSSISSTIITSSISTIQVPLSTSLTTSDSTSVSEKDQFLTSTIPVLPTTTETETETTIGSTEIPAASSTSEALITSIEASTTTTRAPVTTSDETTMRSSTPASYSSSYSPSSTATSVKLSSTNSAHSVPQSSSVSQTDVANSSAVSTTNFPTSPTYIASTKPDTTTVTVAPTTTADIITTKLSTVSSAATSDGSPTSSVSSSSPDILTSIVSLFKTETTAPVTVSAPISTITTSYGPETTSALKSTNVDGSTTQFLSSTDSVGPSTPWSTISPTLSTVETTSIPSTSVVQSRAQSTSSPLDLDVSSTVDVSQKSRTTFDAPSLTTYAETLSTETTTTSSTPLGDQETTSYLPLTLPMLSTDASPSAPMTSTLQSQPLTPSSAFALDTSSSMSLQSKTSYSSTETSTLSSTVLEEQKTTVFVITTTEDSPSTSMKAVSSISGKSTTASSTAAFTTISDMITSTSPIKETTAAKGLSTGSVTRTVRSTSSSPVTVASIITYSAPETTDTTADDMATSTAVASDMSSTSGVVTTTAQTSATTVSSSLKEETRTRAPSLVPTTAESSISLSISSLITPTAGQSSTIPSTTMSSSTTAVNSSTDLGIIAGLQEKITDLMVIVDDLKSYFGTDKNKATQHANNMMKDDNEVEKQLVDAVTKTVTSTKPDSGPEDDHDDENHEKGIALISEVLTRMKDNISEPGSDTVRDLLDASIEGIRTAPDPVRSAVEALGDTIAEKEASDAAGDISDDVIDNAMVEILSAIVSSLEDKKRDVKANTETIKDAVAKTDDVVDAIKGKLGVSDKEVVDRIVDDPSVSGAFADALIDAIDDVLDDNPELKNTRPAKSKPGDGVINGKLIGNYLGDLVNSGVISWLLNDESVNRTLNIKFGDEQLSKDAAAEAVSRAVTRLYVGDKQTPLETFANTLTNKLDDNDVLAAAVETDSVTGHQKDPIVDALREISNKDPSKPVGRHSKLSVNDVDRFCGELMRKLRRFGNPVLEKYLANYMEEPSRRANLKNALQKVPDDKVPEVASEVIKKLMPNDNPSQSLSNVRDDIHNAVDKVHAQRVISDSKSTKQAAEDLFRKLDEIKINNPGIRDTGDQQVNDDDFIAKVIDKLPDTVDAIVKDYLKMSTDAPSVKEVLRRYLKDVPPSNYDDLADKFVEVIATEQPYSPLKKLLDKMVATDVFDKKTVPPLTNKLLAEGSAFADEIQSIKGHSDEQTGNTLTRNKDLVNDVLNAFSKGARRVIRKGRYPHSYNMRPTPNWIDDICDGFTEEWNEMQNKTADWLGGILKGILKNAGGIDSGFSDTLGQLGTLIAGHGKPPSAKDIGRYIARDDLRFRNADATGKYVLGTLPDIRNELLGVQTEARRRAHAHGDDSNEEETTLGADSLGAFLAVTFILVSVLLGIFLVALVWRHLRPPLGNPIDKLPTLEDAVVTEATQESEPVSDPTQESDSSFPPNSSPEINSMREQCGQSDVDLWKSKSAAASLNTPTAAPTAKKPPSITQFGVQAKSGRDVDQGMGCDF